MIDILNFFKGVGKGILGYLFVLLGHAIRIIFIWPWNFLTKSMGYFKGFFIYLAYIMVVFSAFIKWFDHQASKVAWKKMENFSTLSYSERATIIDMAEIAAYAYVTDSNAHVHLSYLHNKGYTPLENPHINNTGLTYVTLQKGNTIYLAFRGSTTIDDWDTDARMILSLTTTRNTRFAEAANVAHRLLRIYPDKNLVVVGHSLGGAMVQYVVNVLPDKRLTRAYTFNPLGIPNGVTRTGTNKLIDVVHEADIAQLVMGEKHVVGRGILVHGTPEGNEIEIKHLLSQHSLEKSIANMRRQHGAY